METEQDRGLNRLVNDTTMFGFDYGYATGKLVGSYSVKAQGIVLRQQFQDFLKYSDDQGID
jgi:hypothetical protein